MKSATGAFRWKVIVLPSHETAASYSACCSGVAVNGPGYCERPLSSWGMSRYWIAYEGPAPVMSVANVRDTP